MIKIKKMPGTDILECVYEGEITHENYQKVLIPALEEAIKGEKKPISAICDLRGMTSIECKAIWDDYKFGMEHIKDFKRLATVGDQWWMGPLMKVSAPFYRSIELKHFKGDQYEEALNWIKRK